MDSTRLFPTVLICLLCLATLSGCASMFPNGPDGFPDGFNDNWDSTPTSQSAPSSDENDRADANSDEYHRIQVAQAIQTRDIVPGMSPREVVEAWGRPRDVQVAGDGSHGDERWVYYTDNSLVYGISRHRIIYFENGRVAGWETR